MLTNWEPIALLVFILHNISHSFFLPKSELLHVLKLPSIVSLHLKQAEFTFLGNTDTEDEIEDKRRQLGAQGLEP